MNLIQVIPGPYSVETYEGFQFEAVILWVSYENAEAYGVDEELVDLYTFKGEEILNRLAFWPSWWPIELRGGVRP